MPRRPDPQSQRRLGLGLSLVLLAFAGVLALAVPERSGGRGATLSVLLADGTLAHENSRDGSAILTASGVWPGWSGDGDVTITNTGTAGSWLRLTGASAVDAPGPGGGALSTRMLLVIEDTTVPGFSVPVYSGTLGGVGERWLGRLEPGEERAYRFSTVMPSGSGDNAYQSSAVTARFDWAVSDIEPDPEPEPEPEPQPGVNPPAEQPPAQDPSTEQPPAEDPPGEEPPAGEPPTEGPDEVEVIPEDEPVVAVNRHRLTVRLAVPAAQRPFKARSLLAFASCSRRCRATVGGKLWIAKGRPSGHRIGGRSRTFPAGIKSRVKLRIPPRALASARRALNRGRTVHGRIQIVARDSGGRTTRATQRIRLVPARKR